MSGVRCICVLEHDDDEPVVAHSATDVINRARLRLTAWMLSAFRHPGVVQLVSLDDGDGSTTLRTRFVGSRTLETTPPLSSVVLATNAAAVAQVAADLHASGITHGAIEPSHVLLAGPGRPVLCGFGRGVLMADCSPDVWSEATRVDVRQLCDMIETLLAGLSPLSDIALRHRIGEIRRRRRIRRQIRSTGLTPVDAGELASRFANIAPAHPRPVAGLSSRATSETSRLDRHTADRPTYARVNDLADTPVSRAEFLPPEFPTTEGAPPRNEDPLHGVRVRQRQVARRLAGSRAFQIALFLVGATCVGLGTHAVRSGGSGQSTGHAARSAASAARPTHCPAARSGATTSPAAESIPGIDIDGDGCADDVSITGWQLTVNGSTYSIGKDGDQTYLGDWDGDGISTPALLRPDTGAVFFFNVWPSPGAPLEASATTHVKGATGARVASTAAGQSHLIVQRTSGPDVPVHFRIPTRGATQP